MNPNKPKKCGVCETPSLERNNYFYGKQFTVRDLMQEQRYLNAKRRIVNQTVLGWGVVCGLDVCWKSPNSYETLVVEPGMAIDCCGNEIIICDKQPVEFEEYKAASEYVRQHPEEEKKFVLCLEYYECKTEPVEIPPEVCDKQNRTEYNRVREGAKLKIKEWEDACPEQPAGRVGCLSHFKKDSSDPQTDISCHTDPIHEHLCSVIKEDCPECKDCDCVVLATIYVRRRRVQQQEEADQNRRPVVIDVDLDTCTDRRLVYNNSLLYDLIYCYHGDLPHIVDFNWRGQTYPDREIEWDNFVRMMQHGLTVYFDKEMEANSLNRHTFIVSYLHKHSGTGIFQPKRIPVKEIKARWDGKCFAATFYADDDWVDNELRPNSSELRPNRDEYIDIEIILRGSRIWSTKGKALDGDFLADKLPTGNGTQGGDFVDWFRVFSPGPRPYRI